MTIRAIRKAHSDPQYPLGVTRGGEFDIPSAASLSDDQYSRLMSTDIGYTNKRGKFDARSINDIREDPVARNTFRGRTVLHSNEVFGNKMFYQD